MRAPDLLEAGAATYRERNKTYGDNYKQFGHLMVALFPDGLPREMSANDWNRFAVFMHILTKVSRYAVSFKTGHVDSAHDAMVYSAMLEELTRDVPDL